MGDSVNDDRQIARTLPVLEALFANFPSRNFSVRLWNGRTWLPPSANSPAFTLRINNPAVLRRVILSPNELSLGEAYIRNDLDVEGDLEEAFILRDHLVAKRGPLEKIRIVMKALALPVGEPGNPPFTRLRGSRHSIKRDSQAIGYHYDVSNDFYRLWLDEKMVYSCGYFRKPDDTLDAAQEQKLDYLARKLRLKPGERLLDIGCGWGGLLIHAASKYGAVTHGITVSRAQYDFTRERIEKAGLADRCTVELRDYRELEPKSQYDKIVSVGMFEHVGRERLSDYFRGAWSLLRPQGLFLNHGIADATGSASRGRSFIDAYVFPDGDLLPVCDTLKAAETCGFEVRDVESLREHYVLTLRHWVRRLEQKYEEGRQLTNERICRIWRLYMAGSAYGFRTGRINVYQTLLAKPDNGEAGLPLTRGYMLP